MDTNARYELWQSVEALAAWVIRRFAAQYGPCKAGYETDDLMQEAYIVHDQCCEAWKAGYTATYSTYYATALWHRLQRIYGIRSDCPAKIDMLDLADRMCTITDDGISQDIDDICSVDDLVYVSHTIPRNPQELVEQREVLEIVAELMENMPDDTYRVVLEVALCNVVAGHTTYNGKPRCQQTRKMYRAKKRVVDKALRLATGSLKRKIEDYTGLVLHETIYSKDRKSIAVIY